MTRFTDPYTEPGRYIPGFGGINMKKEPNAMTNRELFTEYEREDCTRRFDLAVEMTKRINRKMITPDVPHIFKQYKLNGAGDEYK